MSVAVDIAIADLPLGVLVPLGLALAMLIYVLVRWRLRPASPKYLDEFGRQEDLAFEYYLDEDGLRHLAAALRIEVPESREVTKRHTGGLSFGKLFSGERGRDEARQIPAAINLNALARALSDKLSPRYLADDLTRPPGYSDQEVLTEVVEQLKRGLDTQSEARDLLQRLVATYNDERRVRIAKEKRAHLQQAAHDCKVILLSGEFKEVVTADAKPGSTVMLKALDLEPDHEDDLAEPRSNGGELVGFGIRVVFPDQDAFTPAGRERINRGQPFYGRVIAHSPSFDPRTGLLVCSAYAVWGTTRASRRDASIDEHIFAPWRPEITVRRHEVHDAVEPLFD